jgi:xanthine dehydrogenase accessory factor
MIVLLRGGGDLASGVALRLYRAGLKVLIAERDQPLAVRRLVAFSSAIYHGEMTVEGVTARRVADYSDTLRILQVLSKGQLPVFVDPEARSVPLLHPTVVVDARMTKQRADLIPTPVQLIIGLGPGFTAGENCHAVIETNRGHMLGRVFWNGTAQPDTGQPDAVAEQRSERVLRAPANGELVTHAEIGDHLQAGQLLCEVDGHGVTAPFKGVLRGLLHPGVHVTAGLKIGDVDPRDDPRYCTLVSDKALAVGGAVMEAMLSRVELRKQFWS